MNVILIIFRVFLWVFENVPPIVLLLVVIREYFPRLAFWKFAKMESDLATDICSKPKCRSRLFKAYIRMINRKIRMVARYGETKVEISFKLQREIELPLTEREQALLRIHYMKKGFDVAHYSSNLDSGIILHWPKFPQQNQGIFLPSLKEYVRSGYIYDDPMAAYRFERIKDDERVRAYKEQKQKEGN